MEDHRPRGGGGGFDFTQFLPHDVQRKYPLPIRSPAQLMEIEGVTAETAVDAQRAFLHYMQHGNSDGGAAPRTTAAAVRQAHLVGIDDDDDDQHGATGQQQQSSASAAVAPPPSSSGLHQLTLKQLQLQCGEQSLSTAGTKKDLVRRLEDLAERARRGEARPKVLAPSTANQVDYRNFLSTTTTTTAGGAHRPARTRVVAMNTTAASQPHPQPSRQICVVVDSRERLHADRGAWQQALAASGTPHRTSTLPVGDFVFVSNIGADNEAMMPVIIERKTADDLSKSIISPRYELQKAMLRECMLPTVLYVVDMDGVSRAHEKYTAIKRAAGACLSTALRDEHQQVMVVADAEFTRMLPVLARVLQSAAVPEVKPRVTLAEWSSRISERRDELVRVNTCPRMLSVLPGVSEPMATMISRAAGGSIVGLHRMLQGSASTADALALRIEGLVSPLRGRERARLVEACASIIDVFSHGAAS